MCCLSAFSLKFSHIPGGMPMGGGLIREPPMNAAGMAGRIVVTIGATGVPGIAILIGGPARIGNRCIMALLNASCCLA